MTKGMTIKELQGMLDDVNEMATQRQSKIQALTQEITQFKNVVAETRGQFDDLKERLATAEFENQRLRGYIARVQEDDVVREELVAQGDPDGEVRLTPKRKHERFVAPDHRAGSAALDEDFMHQHLRRGGDPRRKPKHWVTY